MEKSIICYPLGQSIFSSLTYGNNRCNSKSQGCILEIVQNSVHIWPECPYLTNNLDLTQGSATKKDTSGEGWRAKPAAPLLVLHYFLASP